MADLLDNASSMLNRVLRTHAARTVSYGRSGETSVELPAVVGETRYDSIESNGYGVQVTIRDYIIAAEDLVIGGSATEPREGDTVTDTVNGTERVFTVFPGGFGGQAFELSDPQGRRFRIHTQETG